MKEEEEGEGGEVQHIQTQAVYFDLVGEEAHEADKEEGRGIENDEVQ